MTDPAGIPMGYAEAAKDMTAAPADVEKVARAMWEADYCDGWSWPEVVKFAETPYLPGEPRRPSQEWAIGNLESYRRKAQAALAVLPAPAACARALRDLLAAAFYRDGSQGRCKLCNSSWYASEHEAHYPSCPTAAARAALAASPPPSGDDACIVVAAQYWLHVRTRVIGALERGEKIDMKAPHWDLGAAETMLAGALRMRQDEYAASLAAPKPPPSGWQDISTAPKDGTPILAWAVDTGSGWHGWLPVLWRDGTVSAGWYLLDPSEDDEGNGAEMVGGLTHWQPLPSPPARATEPPR